MIPASLACCGRSRAAIQAVTAGSVSVPLVMPAIRSRAAVAGCRSRPRPCPPRNCSIAKRLTVASEVFLQQGLEAIANLFMYYGFDAWMAREFPGVRFERYCDDAVVHCASEQQARQVRDAIAGALAQVGLDLHPHKTKIVYCKDADRTGWNEHEKFTFLGYEFRPRLPKNRYGSPGHIGCSSTVTATGSGARPWRCWIPSAPGTRSMRSPSLTALAPSLRTCEPAGGACTVRFTAPAATTSAPMSRTCPT
jgi:hypothetical protein